MDGGWVIIRVQNLTGQGDNFFIGVFQCYSVYSVARFYSGKNRNLLTNQLCFGDQSSPDGKARLEVGWLSFELLAGNQNSTGASPVGINFSSMICFPTMRGTCP
jgi:hypothetical protein